MFFTLSKIFWFVAAPLNFLWLLALAGLVLRHWKRQLGNRILLITAGLFLIFGFLPIGENMMVFLETRYHRPESLSSKIDGIIVLGGAFNTSLSAKTGMVSANNNISRMLDFADLARRYPNARLVFSGGSGSLFSSDEREADDAEKFMTDIGIQERRITYERNSRNSYENVVLSHQMVNPKAGETWIVITSAFHMPRVMGIFAAQNWDVIPYPSAPRTDGTYHLNPFPLNVSGNFYMLSTATKEMIGIGIYALTGKSALNLSEASLDSNDSQ